MCEGKQRQEMRPDAHSLVGCWGESCRLLGRIWLLFGLRLPPTQPFPKGDLADDQGECRAGDAQEDSLERESDSYSDHGTKVKNKEPQDGQISELSINTDMGKPVRSSDARRRLPPKPRSLCLHPTPPHPILHRPQRVCSQS